ncbi:MAG TPA: NAD-dependent epimerase/dehydratase family protein [Gemmataceae bacterium]|nr:NAD-dependent epimerase/dehydratase family protein [Gemmataceae bacterium]
MTTLNSIATIEELEDRLSEPTPSVIETLGRIEGDLIVLGAGGKMGPSLARMARRASDAAGVRRRILAVSRFSCIQAEASLQAHGIETRRCDLLDPDQLKELPDTANVIFMTGLKFGSTGREALTWATNAYLPGLVCQKYRRSRIAVFSTGNVYGLTPVAQGGSRESDALRPLGEYAMSVVGRERLFDFFSRRLDIPVALLRLNYATELRYGVLVDVAQHVRARQPIDLSMGYVNAIWQGDANAMALQALARAASPPCVLNIAGPELLSVRQVAEQFGQLLSQRVVFQGQESAEAFLSNAQQAHRWFGYPRVCAAQMMEWIAAWVRADGVNLGKPTHFDVRNGCF